ncbi:MAG TPA: fibronectin type III domain-containing protein, partial [Acidimicrobiales bacterium]|nr:fibronectin type III domain-containing protein [Acidimicrobiales bacterium]
MTLKFDGTGTPAAGNFLGVEVRICRGGLTNIGLQSQYNPTQGGNCLPPSGDPSISADTYGAVNDRDNIVLADPTDTFATVPFKVGTGSVTFQANAVSTVTCNAANPCALWAKEQFKTSLLPAGFGWWHFDLNYAGPPTAPVVSPVTPAGNTTETVNWTAPTNAGNAPITGYTVTLSPGGATQTVSGSTTTANFTGLSNFTAYTASVTATNTAADGSTNTSPAGTATFTPSPPAPTNAAALAANQSALLTWTAPTGPAPTGYSVVIHQVTPAGADIGPIATGSTATSYNATGLTNGTVYTFQVAAVYGANTGSLSAPSPAFTPQGKYVTQTITVTRPQGDLVLTQICGNHANIPVDPAVGNWWPGSAAIPAVTTGTAPNLGAGPVDSGTADPLFNQYPYPVDANG